MACHSVVWLSEYSDAKSVHMRERSCWMSLESSNWSVPVQMLGFCRTAISSAVENYSLLKIKSCYMDECQTKEQQMTVPSEMPNIILELSGYQIIRSRGCRAIHCAVEMVLSGTGLNGSRVYKWAKQADCLDSIYLCFFLSYQLWPHGWHKHSSKMGYLKSWYKIRM